MVALNEVALVAKNHFRGVIGTRVCVGVLRKGAVITPPLAIHRYIICIKKFPAVISSIYWNITCQPFNEKQINRIDAARSYTLSHSTSIRLIIST